MTINNNLEALASANASTTNVVGTCQKWTRERYNAPSAGDQDGDGDADANDGWRLEPEWARHYGDRKPPAGFPLYFKNRDGSGFGHRNISKGGGNTRGTDMKDGHYHPGTVGNATIEEVEDAMGLVYVGWSKTISGIPIPVAGQSDPPKPVPNEPTQVMIARRHLNRALRRAKARGNHERAAKIQKALDILPRR